MSNANGGTAFYTNVQQLNVQTETISRHAGTLPLPLHTFNRKNEQNGEQINNFGNTFLYLQNVMDYICFIYNPLPPLKLHSFGMVSIHTLRIAFPFLLGVVEMLFPFLLALQWGIKFMQFWLFISKQFLQE